MFKLASYFLPFILNAPSKRSANYLARLLAAYFTMCVAVLMILTALIIWIATTYNAVVAFAAVGGALLASASLVVYIINSPLRKKRNLIASAPASTDPIGKFLPEAIKSHPTVQTLLAQIGENPVTAAAAAVTIGALISKEFFED
jgi:hypothetical protein